nr:hypothetical protein [Tanacetum cinerariifolium]
GSVPAVEHSGVSGPVAFPQGAEGQPLLAVFQPVDRGAVHHADPCFQQTHGVPDVDDPGRGGDCRRVCARVVRALAGA